MLLGSSPPCADPCAESWRSACRLLSPYVRPRRYCRAEVRGTKEGRAEVADSTRPRALLRRLMLYPTELRARAPTISGDDPRGADRRLGGILGRRLGGLDAARVNGLAQRLERGRGTTLAAALAGLRGRGGGGGGRRAQTGR